MSMSAEICVVRDLLQHHQQLFDVYNKDVEHERRLLAEQQKPQSTAAVDKVTNSTFSLSFLSLVHRSANSGEN